MADSAARNLIRLCLCCCGLAIGSVAVAAPCFRDGFEGPDVRWRITDADARHRVVGHRCVQTQAHQDASSEELTIVAQGGSYIYAAYPVEKAPVIDETAVSLWVRSDKPGLQLAARVVLPRTVDPKTRQPVTLLIYGEIYQRRGQWQQLSLDRLPSQLARQVRVAQSDFDGTIDPREAFVSEVLLNVYGGAGTTTVWIDDLEIKGVVGQVRIAGSGGYPVRPAQFESPAAPRRTAPPPRIAVTASVLTVNGWPLFPRVVEYRGEPFEFLRRLGFNVVALSAVPTPQQRVAATQQGLWLICPPPAGPPPAGPPSAVPSPAGPSPQPIDASFDCVLAWDVGEWLTGQELPATAEEICRLRSRDAEVQRPILCCPQTDIRSYSRHVDLVLHRRQPLRTTMEMADYASMLRDLTRLVRPGTPLLTCVPTEGPEQWSAQVAALSRDGQSDTALDIGDLRHLAYTAIAAGARGLLFTSPSRLDADTEQARRRARMLELMNVELQLIEQWVAGGRAATPAKSSNSAVETVVLQADRSRILLPVWSAGGGQYVEPVVDTGPISFVVPGVADTSGSYQLLPVGLPSLGSQRVAGGLSVAMHEPAIGRVVLLTGDSRLVNGLSQRIAQIGRRTAQLQRDLAADQIGRVERVTEKLAAGGVESPSSTATHFVRAKDFLQQCDRHFAAGDYRRAFDKGRQAESELATIRRDCWSQAVRQFGPPAQFPLLTSFYTLPDCYQWLNRIDRTPWSANRIAAGELENLDQMLAAGWRHAQLDQRQFAAAVALSAQGARSGNHCLQLHVAAGADAPELITSAPLWITTPAVYVGRGQLVEIRAWINVPAAIRGTVDGLMVFDSHSGPSLAERVANTGGWQEIRMYRAATETGPLTVTFALAGIGDAWIDDVSVRVMNDGYHVTELPGHSIR